MTAAYGPEYVGKLKQGFAGRWMDVLPRTGKAGGAYMQGSAYDVHPYLHLNHNYDYRGAVDLRARMGSWRSHAC